MKQKQDLQALKITEVRKQILEIFEHQQFNMIEILATLEFVKLDAYTYIEQMEAQANTPRRADYIT